MSVKFKDGSAATEEEVNAIARAFGFMSWQEMERACRAGDKKRAARRGRSAA